MVQVPTRKGESPPPDRGSVAANVKQTAKRSKKKSNSEPTTKRLMLSFRIEALCLFALATMLLSVSMPHLAGGISAISQASLHTSWFMAIVIDMAQIVAEAALILGAFADVEKRVTWLALCVIGCCTVLSIALNIDAFLIHAETTKNQVMATILGIILPIGALSLFRLGAAYAVCGPRLGGKRGEQ